MNPFLPIISFGAIGLILMVIFLSAFKLDQNDWRTKLYALFMLLFGALIGLVIHFIGDDDSIKISNIYIITQFLLLLTGIFHLWFMYQKLFWSKRNTFDTEKDSVLAELVYTLVIICFIVIGLMGVYGYFTDFDKTKNYWMVGISFLLPFLFVKSYDFLNQIPYRDFSKKWIFTDDAIRENNWRWENEAWVNFEVKEKLDGLKTRSNRSATFRIKVPRKVPVREVFRLAIREYNKKGPEIIVQDLGFEQENAGKFWWLFSVKRMWNRPDTWFRKVRYLDPYSSSLNNEVRSKDIIWARRMLTKEALENPESYFDDDIPVGQLIDE